MRIVMEKMACLLVLIGIIVVFFVVAGPLQVQAAEKKISWKGQSTWTAGPGHQQAVNYFANTLNKAAGDRFHITMHSAGEIVGPLQVFDAVSKGSLDMGIGSVLYIEGKMPGISVLGGVLAPLHDTIAHLVWLYEGGGIELINKNLEKYNLVAFPNVIIESEQIWSKKPIRSLDDFKGLKIRATGLNMAFFNRLGASAVMMSMGDTVAALERGVIDAAEFCAPYTDYPAGLYDVCDYIYFGKIHQPHLATETFINRDKWNELPDDLKALVKLAIRDQVFWYFHKYKDLNMHYIEQMKKKNIKLHRFSPEFEKKFAEVRKSLLDEYSKKYPHVAEARKQMEDVNRLYVQMVELMGY